MLYGSEEGYPNPPINLADYDDVYRNADWILDRVTKPENDPALMPPRPRGPWSPDLIDLFRRWIDGGKPR